MRKSIRKPKNWQDFETLCKILWGEIWGIPDKIKQHARQGQAQWGVDIYGVSKGKINYSGIQCKGKDDYTNAKVTKDEIDREIENAKKFTPALETLIFATTANKDVEIEAYVRQKDLESRIEGGFEILIFCWEDIADLIETNRNTFNYYVLNNQFKSNYELTVAFENGLDRFTILPKFKKTITRHIIKPAEITEEMVRDQQLRRKYFGDNVGTFQFHHAGIQNINCSWASFEMIFQNTGSTVIEDYRLIIYPEENKFRELRGYLGNVMDRINYFQHSPLYVNEEEGYAVYRPKENAPLIQKDSKSFDLHILTLHEKYELKIAYEFLARDFNQEGMLILQVEPEYEEAEIVVWVNKADEIEEDKILVEDIKKAGPLF